MLDYKLIGERLKKARKAKNITQEELVDKLEVSIAFLSRLESAGYHINLKRLNQICEILDVSESDILSGTATSSSSYLEKDFQKLLDLCDEKQKRLAYKLIKIILEE